jgi:hypothetical protein
MKYHVLGDLLTQNATGKRDWVRLCPEVLRQRLPEPPSDAYPLTVGQYWLMGSSTDHVRIGSVVRIDGRIQDSLVVTLWKVKLEKKTYRRVNTHKQYVIPYDSVFPGDRATRVSKSKGATKFYIHKDLRIVSKP